MLAITRLQTFVLSAPVAQGPESSLGAMPARRGLLLRLEDEGGAHGWGEVWCNFPPHGAESRAHLVVDVIAPVLVGKRFGAWDAIRPALETQLARMMLHTGEAGAFAQCFAGIDTAAADLAARASGRPLRDFLGGGDDRVEVYASSPSLADRAGQCARLVADGHRAIKLKVGSAPATDRQLVAGCRAAIGPAIPIMLDANQAWLAGDAAARIHALEAFGIGFVEEPLRADETTAAWARLAREVRVPLAAGENIVGETAFAERIAGRAIGVVQPDLCKWGGVSGAMQVGRMALEAGVRAAPHYMSTALGLAATLHVKAALGGAGRVELDVNDNPLRTRLGPIDLAVADGRVAVPAQPGIGFEPDRGALGRLCTSTADVRA